MRPVRVWIVALCCASFGCGDDSSPRGGGGGSVVGGGGAGAGPSGAGGVGGEAVGGSGGEGGSLNGGGGSGGILATSAAAVGGGGESGGEATGGGGGADLCAGVQCQAEGICHEVGVCEPSTGLCSDPLTANGSACNADGCTFGAQCQSGSCSGGDELVCLGGATCSMGACIASSCNGPMGVQWLPQGLPGTDLQSIAVADIDGDSLVDFVVTDRVQVRILSALGGGFFSAPVSYTAGTTPTVALTAALDADASPDLIVLNENSNDVTVRLNASGTFGPPAQYAVGTKPKAILANDIDGDGTPDLVVVNETSNNVAILFNVGDGSLLPAELHTVGSAPGAVIAADLDGDGDVDLATSNSASNNVSVLLNQGGGAFGSAVSYAANFFPRSLAAADFDGDSAIDLALITSFPGGGSGITVLENLGAGTFAAPVQQPTGDAPLIAKDFDGDGAVDLAAGRSVFGNQGGFSFSPIYDEPAPAIILGEDVNGDGSLDLAYVERFGIRLTFGDGMGGFVPVNRHIVYGPPVAIAAGDLNGDGYSDLAFASPSETSQISTMLSHGDGTFGPAIITTTFQPTPGTIALADLDDNGSVDILTPDVTSNSVTVLYNDGLGAFGLGNMIRPSTGFGQGAAVAAVPADFDEDGLMDIAVSRTVSNTIELLLNTGNHMFDNPPGTPIGGVPGRLVASDFNGDGHVDVVAAKGAAVTMLPGLGNGSFGASTDFAVPSPRALAAADLDGDGDLDLAVASFSSDAMNLLLNAGDGTFAPPVSYAVGDEPLDLIATDVNGDGAIDLAVASSQGDTVMVFRNDGSAGMTLESTYAVRRVLAIAALDAYPDGVTDIFAASLGSPHLLLRRGCLP